ncbi:MAG: hypothetical protein FGM33_08845 [Candidatus Kapabacteria bacterium]|nr:hypothetical protein [Candidatus Kapabacteria bacterium]
MILMSPTTITLFVGAGASRYFGVPTANAIAHQIVDDVLASSSGTLLRGIKDVYEEPLRELLRKFLLRTFPAIKSHTTERPSITDILSIVDYAIATDTNLPFDLNDGSVFDMHEVRRALEHCIMKIIDRPQKEARIKSTLTDMKRNVKAWTEKDQHEFTLISTNYDTIMDRVMYDVQSEFKEDQRASADLGTSFRLRFGIKGRLISRNAEAPKRLYKLHGSLNWLMCPACENIYIASVDENLTKYVGNTYGVSELNDCHCGHAPLRPLIISPSYVRDVRATALREIWRSAQEALRTSGVWIFVGYSLPAEDVAIRSMIARARMSISGLKGKRKVHVYDVSQGRDGNAPEVEARYRIFLQSDDTEITYHNGGMEEFLDDIRNGFDTILK